ncbi:MAG TPA: ATP-binding protein [Actinomycetota bacterium]|nr:ATP-binding protein [Actinomycetota bacterium]
MTGRPAWPSPKRSPAARVAVAIVAPAVATGLGVLLQPERELGATSIYLLAVVVASAIGGRAAGLAASILGFLSLNFFFTEPLHTFEVADREDVTALVVFLIVALIVGSLVARIVDERERAARREQEASLQSYLATKLLASEPLERVLGDFAAALLDPLRLERCEIRASIGERAVEVSRERPRPADGSVVEVPLEVGGERVGSILVTRRSEFGKIVGEDRRLLDAAAGQLTGALTRIRLDDQVSASRVDIQTNEARAALFSSVTHDLRTPLASIKAGVTTLLDPAVAVPPVERDDLLRTILEETDRLNRLVGNLLDLARVRAGAIAPAKQPVALDEVVDSVLHRLAPALEHVRVRTMFRDVQDVPADPIQIDQVVTNLLENAVRFSPRGGEIVVGVAPWRGAVQVRVTDQGPGIAEADRERVFETFYRGDERGGSGLGLSISRAIVGAHGGRIWVEGAPTGGASVVFELPAHDATAVDAEADR